MDLFHPGTPSLLSLEARVRVIADIAGALVQIHENSGVPRQHRRHGRLTPRHLLIGVDGSASLFNAKEPFSKLLPAQPDLGYLAPELLTQAGPSNQQSDVFSLGVLLWEALDNGRLFPHRRAAAISRLIARRSLPTPRIDDEWALPLAEVAMKSLANDPEERYPNATSFWLALREHLPAPDNARAMLSRLVQRALKLELTTEIREAPPYLVPSPLLLAHSLPPERSSHLDTAPSSETSARYSLRPEPSSRQRGTSRPPLDEPEWSLSDPPPRSSEPAHASTGDRASPVPDARRTSARAPISRDSELARRSSMPPGAAPARSAKELVRSAPPPSLGAASEPPLPTLHVSLPRDLVDASMPFYLSNRPAPRAFPWGSLSFAALVFFGVGAAVAFGAVTALRVAPESAKGSLSAPAKSVIVAPATPAPAPLEPLPPSLATPPVKDLASGAIKGDTPPDDTSPEEKPVRADVVKPATSPAARAGRRAAKAARAKAAAAQKAGPVDTEPKAVDTPLEPENAESLPFVEQPY